MLRAVRGQAPRALRPALSGGRLIFPFNSVAQSKVRKKFLVVVDGSPECKLALYYASRRALHTGGQVTLLYVIEPAGFQHWLSVGKVMQSEARAEAEAVLYDLAGEVNRIAHLMPEFQIHEGKRADVLLKLIRNDPDIRILVLGAAAGKDGPGPLVSSFAGQMSGSLPIPVTIVPGDLTLAQLDALV